MTVAEKTQVIDAVNIQVKINHLIDTGKPVHQGLVEQLESLIDNFTADQEDLFVSKMYRQKQFQERYDKAKQSIA